MELKFWWLELFLCAFWVWLKRVQFSFHLCSFLLVVLMTLIGSVDRAVKLYSLLWNPSAVPFFFFSGFRGQGHATRLLWCLVGSPKRTSWVACGQRLAVIGDTDWHVFSTLSSFLLCCCSSPTLEWTWMVDSLARLVSLRCAASSAFTLWFDFVLCSSIHQELEEVEMNALFGIKGTLLFFISVFVVVF